MDRRRPLDRATRPLVLIVDGHDDSLALYSLALSAMGFDVVPVKDGAEACTRAWEMPPDIIVTAFPMPNYDGRKFLQRLNQSPRTRDIPVVVLGGNAQRLPEESQELYGFAAWVSRSCPPAELAEGLRQVLEGRSPAPAPSPFTS